MFPYFQLLIAIYKFTSLSYWIIKMYRRLLAEFIGTFFLVFGVGVSQGQPFTVGGTLWAAQIFTGFSSGGQFNPAVTLAIITRKHITKTLTTADLKELLLFV